MASAFWCFDRDVQFVLRLASVLPFCARTRGQDAATNTCSPWEVVYAHPCKFGSVGQFSEVLLQLLLFPFCVCNGVRECRPRNTHQLDTLFPRCRFRICSSITVIDSFSARALMLFFFYPSLSFLRLEATTSDLTGRQC